MMIERLKDIAAALSRITGREITVSTVNHWINRVSDPIPVQWFAGRPGITDENLREWAKRQEGQRVTRSAKPAESQRTPQLPGLDSSE